MTAVQQIRDHFVHRLQAAELEMWPFPHLFLTEVLPPEVYSAALASDPFAEHPGEPFGSPSWTSRLRFTAHFEHRFQIALNPDGRTGSSHLWDVLGDAFSDPCWLGPVLRDRFPTYFDLRFGDIDAINDQSIDDGFWNGLHVRTFAQRHEPGFQLDAHTDIPSRVATCVFNFPRAVGDESAGTQLLKPHHPQLRCSGNSHHNIADFDVVVTAPYAPNTCLVFFKTRHSWHSVSRDAAMLPGGRLGMQVQLYEPEEGAVVDLSAPDLVRNMQFVPDSRVQRFRSTASRGLRKIGSRLGGGR